MNYAAVPDYRTLSDTDDNPAYLAALATGLTVYFPAGQGLGPSGEYLIETAWGTDNLASGARLIGDGIGRTIIRRIAASGSISNFDFDSGSADVADNLAGLVMLDMTIEDDPDREEGFSEHIHLVNINGASDAIFQRVEFKGFRGDGLHIGSGHILGQERHNERIVVRDCIFDGVDNANRNGISVIDVDDLTVENCVFRNCTKLNDIMPGPIDLEPNALNPSPPPSFFAFPVIRNVRIVGNSFEGCGGAALALLLPSVTLTNQVENIIFERNKVLGCERAFVFSGHSGTDAVSSVKKWGVQLIANQIRGCTKPDHVILDGAFGLVIRRNTFESNGFVRLGVGATSQYVRIEENNFIRCGVHGAGALILDTSIVDAWIEKNHFLECYSYLFFIRGASANLSRLRFNRNRIEGAATVGALAQVGPLGTWTGSADANCQALGNMVSSAIWGGNLVGFGGPSPAYANGWVSFGGDYAPVIRKDDSDIVVVTGAVKSGTTAANTLMFTLPLGHRPAATYVVVTHSNGAVAHLRVKQNGEVEIVSGVSGTDCQLALSFPARTEG